MAPLQLNDSRPPKEARLFVYDVGERKIVRDLVPVPAARATGLIAEAAPGRILGLTMDTADPQRPEYSVGWIRILRVELPA